VSAPRSDKTGKDVFRYPSVGYLTGVRKRCSPLARKKPGPKRSEPVWNLAARTMETLLHFSFGFTRAGE